MNLSKLFELQAALDTHIEHEHPELQNSNNLEWKVLALLVELGECANEWRGFKKWSNDQEPRYEKMLEEYVDCLHFALSIGIEKGFEQKEFAYLHEVNVPVYKQINTLQQFNSIFYAVSEFITRENLESYEELFLYFIALAEHLNFKWEQIEQAYIKKNEANHQRQLSGY